MNCDCSSASGMEDCRKPQKVSAPTSSKPSGTRAVIEGTRRRRQTQSAGSGRPRDYHTIVGGSAPPDAKGDDNHLVCRLLAAAILVVFASLNALDGICCPDGCTHERESTSQQHGDHSGDGSCMLCLGSIDSAAVPGSRSIWHCHDSRRTLAIRDPSSTN